MHLAIAYDISDDGTRRRVYRTLQEYGAWRQYSVFELEITKTERIELENHLESLIDASEGDRIRVYRLCSSCSDDIADIGAEPPDEQSNVV